MRTIKELSNMKGRTALITGGAGHIANAIEEALAECGCNLILVDLNESNLKLRKEYLEKTFNVNIKILEKNLEKEEHIKEISDFIKNDIEVIDVLFNNAAFVGDTKLEGWGVPFEQQSMKTWRRAVEVNLNSTFYLTQLLTPSLRKSGHGSIINLGSIYGVCGPDMSIYEGTAMGNAAAYAASKGGLLQLTKWLSTTLAPDIRINSITPGGVERNQLESFQKAYIKKTPLKRMATEEDFKGAALYLASDLSLYVTGQNIIVDGGWTVW